MILGSGFLAVLNVLVYAGAIIVLFLFTMMLLNLHQQEEDRYLHRYQTGWEFRSGRSSWSRRSGYLLPSPIPVANSWGAIRLR